MIRSTVSYPLSTIGSPKDAETGLITILSTHGIQTMPNSENGITIREMAESESQLYSVSLYVFQIICTVHLVENVLVLQRVNSHTYCLYSMR
jgi:hypothetical protein